MNKKVIYSVIGVAAIAVIACITVIFRQRSEMKEMVEQMEFEKEELENEYQDLAIQFDGYQGLDIRNDSLQDLLSKEQQRVQDLLEELRVTKVTNARRISELKKELATVRAVMVQYVAQIDSLSRDNSRLTAENREVRQQYEQVSEEAHYLRESNTQLTEVVTRASMLEVGGFSVVPLNKNDRKTRILSHVAKLEISYTIQKNITAKPGMKTVYIAIINPEGNIISTDGQRFIYEGGEVPYSVSHDVEFTGEQLDDVVYFTALTPFDKGIYNADFFIDGALVGSFPFQVKK